MAGFQVYPPNPGLGDPGGTVPMIA